MANADIGAFMLPNMFLRTRDYPLDVASPGQVQYQKQMIVWRLADERSGVE
jgi:hypothetical protein